MHLTGNSRLRRLLEKGVVEHKYYCRGINGTDAGVVAIEEHHGKTVRTELVEVTHN